MRIKYFLITAVLATAILCSAGFVSAQTADNSALIAQLQAQIAQLTAQLQQLITQQGGQTWCHTFNTYLVAGTHDSSVLTPGSVASLQTALEKEGFLTRNDAGLDSGPTTGLPAVFGKNTAAGVVSFQGKYNIRQTGTVGPITRAKLNSLYGCGTTPTPIPTTCIPNWICGWGPCMNGSQSQVAMDSNNCGLSSSGANIACPALARLCNSSTQPSITITSPNTDTTWTAGQTYKITWQETGLDNVNLTISLVNQGSGSNLLIVVGIPASAGSYSYTLPLGAANILGSGCKIYIQDTTGGVNSTGNITVVAPSTTCNPACLTNQTCSSGQCVPTNASITITSSLSGAKLIPGQTYPITWTSSNIDPNAQVEISLNPSGPGPDYTGIAITKNSGTYNWTIPESGWMIPYNATPESYSITIIYALSYDLYTGTTPIATSAPSASFNIVLQPCNLDSDCAVNRICSNKICIPNPNFVAG